MDSRAEAPVTKAKDRNVVVDSDGVQKRDIVDIALIWEDKMNQLIYADKQGYYVYKEEDDSSVMLRKVTGGHKTNITTIKFSYHLSLVATGAENGEVGVWDYELSQLLGVCHGHAQSDGDITAIEFLAPYPVMATAGQDSKVILWGVRPMAVELCYVAIGMFHNISFNFQDEAKLPVKSLLCYSGETVKGISRGISMKHSQINAEIYRDFKTSQVLATQDMTVRIDPRGNYRGLT